MATASAPNSTNIRPNITRVRDSSGFVGTVLYVGPVASAKSSEEIYAGIAWDDPTRGRHDGSVLCRTSNQIVRHFKCGPTQGSFLRLKKLDVGVPLSAALMRGRYVQMDAALVAPSNTLPHVARTAGGRDKPIEFWGEVQLRRRQQLEVVDKISLRMLGIARMPSAACSGRDELEEFRHLKSIDLAGNLLCDWEDVFHILRHFENLSSLSLASNRINDLSPVSLEGSGRMTGMTNLNLNSTNISSFKTVALIGEVMPNLEELCLAHCNLSDIECYRTDVRTLGMGPGSTNDDDIKIPAFQNLVLLDLSDCHLTSWKKQILLFNKFPKLESLILNDNPIDLITIRPENADVTMFPKLASLQLAGTSISSWPALDDLNVISSLRSLRLRNCPLTSSLGVGEIRSIAIARLSNLSFFNASPVSARERIESERRYVSNVARELLMVSSGAIFSASDQSLSSAKTDRDDEANNDKKAQICAQHPCFQSLLEKHKETMMSSCVTSGSSNQGNIGDDVIGVTIRSMAASSCGMEPLRKSELSLSLTRNVVSYSSIHCVASPSYWSPATSNLH